MFKTASPQTKSFVIILATIIVGSGVCFWLFGKLDMRSKFTWPKKEIQVVDTSKTQNQSQVYKEPEVDTTNWKIYSDTKYGINFKYDPEWTIKSWKTNDEGYDVLEIDPGKKYYNIKIYANPQSFYVMDGLKTEEATIGGTKAVSVSDMLYGVIQDQSYFTFDIGVSLSLKPKFNALVKTVSFN